ncbi:MAG: serine/threonine-protein kinase [Kofleriaceae bacterium]|nr:serine/threonine-protein kinase [Kofleriaceae bacterium]
MTTPERHALLMRHFDETCELAPDAQAAYLAELATKDAALSRELSELLAHDRVPGTTLERAADALLHGSSSELGAPRATHAALELELELEGVADLEPIAMLGEGGMGRVLLARQRSLQREVAVKVLRETAADRVDDLLAEAVLAGSLEHPNIVPIYVLDRDRAGRPVLVMKRVEGVSWGTLIRVQDHPAWTSLVEHHGDRLDVHLWVLDSVCHALHFAHSRGVVHRDVKADNVMIGAFGEVYLVDWGIASHPRSEPAASRPIGTPGYLAPEMVDALAPPADVRTDVYLLGATLHYALVGRPRHDAPTLLAQLDAARASRPFAYPPEVPEELAAICNRATHRDRAERFASAAAFREALRDFRQHRVARALSDVAWERLDSLRELLAGTTTPEAARVYALASESQFGFQQSLRAWPANTRARDGLRICIETQLAYELGQENLGRAQALLTALDPAPPELVARVTVLREHVRTRSAREAKLAALERARDWGFEARYRVAFLLLACALSIGLWRFALRDRDPATGSPGMLAVYAAVAAAALGIIIVVFRRALLATDVTRHVVLGVVCCMGAIAANRALHAIEAPPAAASMSGDMVLTALGSALSALTIARWFWVFVPLFGAGALVARLVPEVAGSTLVVSATIALALGLVASGRRSVQRGS